MRLLFWAIVMLSPAIGRGEWIAVPQWTLVAPDGRTSAVAVPSHFHDRLPAEPSTYRLRTTVALPPGLRGKPLTLTIARFEGLAELRADGVPAAALDTDAVRIYRAAGPQRWRIDADRTYSTHLPLELVVQHNLSRSAWLETMPRLGTDPLGDPTYRLIRGFNHASSIAAVGAVGMIALLYLLLYLFDRRWTLYGWFTLQTVAALLPIFYLGWLQLLAGRYDTVVADAMLTIGAIAGIEFTPSYFRKKPPRVLEAVFLGVFVLATIFAGNPFRVHLHQRLTMLVVFTMLVYLIGFLIRMARKPATRTDALILLGGFVALGLFGIPNIAAFLGTGELLGGVRTAPIGFMLYCMFQAAVLGRAHVRALREADALNEELRRQIEERSRQLADALARLPVVRRRTGEVLAPGAIVRSHYRIIRPIGSGGMGAVYEVERIGDSRRFAMKVVRDVESTGDLARFAREAEIAARVSHENLVSIADVDVSDTGELFLVMELVPGTSLADWRHRFGDADWARPILRQVAAGLEALHAVNVVHRDLKPANVLLTGDDHVKIADFGIARIDTDPDGTTMRDLTQTGLMIGTPYYMAPELAGGSKIAPPSSDIWSFGVLAYEMLTGREPFEVPPLLLAMVGKQPPPPPDGIPFVVRCLDADPEKRPTAAELRAML